MHSINSIFSRIYSFAQCAVPASEYRARIKCYTKTAVRFGRSGTDTNTHAHGQNFNLVQSYIEDGEY